MTYEYNRIPTLLYYSFHNIIVNPYKTSGIKSDYPS